MEDLGLPPMHRRVAGIDVHRMLHVVTVLIEQADGAMQRHTREFGGFRRDCRALAAWLTELGVELVVMESTGIKRTGVARNPLRAGEKLAIRIDQQLQDTKRNRALVRSFLEAPSVAYISDC